MSVHVTPLRRYERRGRRRGGRRGELSRGGLRLRRLRDGDDNQRYRPHRRSFPADFPGGARRHVRRQRETSDAALPRRTRPSGMRPALVERSFQFAPSPCPTAPPRMHACAYVRTEISSLSRFSSRVSSHRESIIGFFDIGSFWFYHTFAMI